MSLSPMDLAQHYLVDDIPAAISIGDPLHSLLEAIFRNEPLSASSYGILASHGLSAFVAHSIEKAGKGLPAEILPAVNLFQKSVTQLDHTLGHLAANASHTAAQAATRV